MFPAGGSPECCSVSTVSILMVSLISFVPMNTEHSYTVTVIGSVLL